MGKYDLLVFENYHAAENHKYDVVLIGHLLQRAGLNVAVLDIYGEDPCEKMEGLPVVHLTFKKPIPNDHWQKHPKNKLFSLISLIRFLWQQHWYFKKVIREIVPMADRFYCGSYHLGMSRQLLKINKPCYLWGLRSARMTGLWAKFKKNPIIAVRMIMLKYAFMRNPQQFFFISNHIIRSEFAKLGIPQNRMILREERCVEKLGNKRIEVMTPAFSLLTIGMLRPEKRIEMTIKEFLHCNNPDWTYKLAGKSNPKYETTIETMIHGHSNIIRINEYLDYAQFNRLFAETHFVVFADKWQGSSVTNGTMMEALINYRPIIAPNYDPYRFYIEKYGVGILYSPDINGDLSRAIVEAYTLGCLHFMQNIDKFLRTIQFDYVSKKLLLQMYGNKILVG